MNIEDNKIEQEYQAFKTWQDKQSNQPHKAEGATDHIKDFVDQERIKIKQRQTIAMPREYMWIASIIGGVLILSAFPIVVLGMIIGAGVVAKIGCSWFKE